MCDIITFHPQPKNRAAHWAELMEALDPWTSTLAELRGALRYAPPGPNEDAARLRGIVLGREVQELLTEKSPESEAFAEGFEVGKEVVDLYRDLEESLSREILRDAR